MKTLGEVLRESRLKKALILRSVSKQTDIDQSLISKFEKNERKPTKEQLIRLANFYNLSEKELTVNWHSDKIVDYLKYAESATEILKVAERKIVYLKSKNL